MYSTNRHQPTIPKCELENLTTKEFEKISYLAATETSNQYTSKAKGIGIQQMSSIFRQQKANLKELFGTLLRNL